MCSGRGREPGIEARKVMQKLPRDFAALAFVHLGLFAAVVGAGWFAHSQPPKLPVMDEWDLLHTWVESESTWKWILAASGEYRYPLAKSVWLGILRATGYDFAAPQYATLSLLTASSVLFLWTARGLRNRSHPVDVLFPILLLHFGHGFNLQMGYQVGQALAVYGIAGWLWCAGRLAKGGGFGWAILSSIYAGSLILNGGIGLAFTPVVAIWVGYLALRYERSQNRYCAAYFTALHFAALGYGSWAALTSSSEIFQQPENGLEGAIGSLTSAVGCWPDEYWHYIAAAGFVLAIDALSMVALVIRAYRCAHRIAPAAILLVITGLILAAVASHGTGFISRNTTIAAAGLSAAILGLIAAIELRPGGVASWFTGIFGAILSAGIVWLNFAPAIDASYKIRESIHHLDIDIRSGDSPMFLAGKHGGGRGVLMGDRLAIQLRAYRNAGIPPFDKLAEDPVHRVELTAVPSLPLRWKYPAHEYEAGVPAPKLELPEPPRGAIGVRIRVATEEGSGGKKLLLRYLDEATGQSRVAEARPSNFVGRVHLLFPFVGQPRAPILEAGSAMEAVAIETVEWILQGSK